MRDTGTPAGLVSPWPKSIAAVTLFVEDLAAAKRFYVDVFSLGVVYEDETSCALRVGDTLLNLLKAAEAYELIAPAGVGGADAGARVVFTVEVDDVDAMCDTLVARGAQLLNGPMDRPWGVRTASFVCPGGHIWEIAR